MGSITLITQEVPSLLRDTADVLTSLQGAIREEVAELQRVADTELPPELAMYTAKKVISRKQAMEQIKAVLDTTQELGEALADVDKAIDRAIRQQKKWRVIACRAALGEYRTEAILHAAFVDFISDPPSEEELDKQLEDLVVELERFEDLPPDQKELRGITL